MAVRFENTLHEFSTINGVTEDVTDIVLNLKEVRCRLHNEAEEAHATIDVEGIGAHEVITAPICLQIPYFELPAVAPTQRGQNGKHGRRIPLLARPCAHPRVNAASGCMHGFRRRSRIALTASRHTEGFCNAGAHRAAPQPLPAQRRSLPCPLPLPP